ncbi:MAG: type VI secretion system protein ImpH [Planctomycetota bacterium]|jgi:type VI secretion system protein ImpH
MGTKRRRPITDLVRELERNPGGFDFFQAVRVLQANRKQSIGMVGADTSPSKEGIRFTSHPTLGYSGSALRRVKAEGPETPHELEVNFLSMIGVTGALPLHYTEHLLSRLYLRDRSLTDFLDLFQHRSIALFFRAWRKYTFPFADEGSATQDVRRNRNVGVSGMLSSLIGLGTPGMSLPEGLPKNSWMYFAGHFARPVRTADGLERMIAGVCSHQVRYEGHIGSWLTLADSARSRLMPNTRHGGRIRASQRLGMGFVLGSRVWDVQSKVRLHIGPLTGDEYHEWMPGSDACGRLVQLIRSYLGHETDFDLMIHPKDGDVSNIQLGAPDATQVTSPSTRTQTIKAARGGLGRDTWLGGSRARTLPDSARVTVDNLPESVSESSYASA